MQDAESILHRIIFKQNSSVNLPVEGAVVTSSFVEFPGKEERMVHRGIENRLLCRCGTVDPDSFGQLVPLVPGLHFDFVETPPWNFISEIFSGLFQAYEL